MDLKTGFWKDKKVLVTGHTGFKGTWLVYILDQLGAQVSGFSLPPAQPKALYSDLNISQLLKLEVIGDIRDDSKLNETFLGHDYDYVFHLAAQAFVLESYKDPIGTLDTNIMGTARVLKNALANANLSGFGLITTDKVYRNQEWVWPYRENDQLGGLDPYSASKSATEIITLALLNTFNLHNVPVTCFRAGNVIGGGDWSPDRIIPDLVRSIENNSELLVRNPQAVRPWQFILDCLYGYLAAAERQIKDSTFRPSSINFGPSSTLSVSSLIEEISHSFEQVVNVRYVNSNLHESQQLRLDSSFAKTELNWAPKYTPEKAVVETGVWYSKYLAGWDPKKITQESFEAYLNEY